MALLLRQRGGRRQGKGTTWLKFAVQKNSEWYYYSLTTGHLNIFDPSKQRPGILYHAEPVEGSYLQVHDWKYTGVTKQTPTRPTVFIQSQWPRPWSFRLVLSTVTWGEEVGTDSKKHWAKWSWLTAIWTISDQQDSCHLFQYNAYLSQSTFFT